jgi:hypothetical protein
LVLYILHQSLYGIICTLLTFQCLLPSLSRNAIKKQIDRKSAKCEQPSYFLFIYTSCFPFQLYDSFRKMNLSYFLCTFSGNDQLLPSQQEGERLVQLLPKCELRKFDDSGHFLLLVLFSPFLFVYWHDFPCVSIQECIMILFI